MEAEPLVRVGRRGAAARAEAAAVAVYAALLAGSERGQTVRDNQAPFAELGMLPHVAGQQAERSMGRMVLGNEVSLPVLISPTGVQAVHPEGEVAVARAANARGPLMGLELRVEVGRGGLPADVLPDVLDR